MATTEVSLGVKVRHSEGGRGGEVYMDDYRDWLIPPGTVAETPDAQQYLGTALGAGSLVAPPVEFPSTQQPNEE